MSELDGLKLLRQIEEGVAGKTGDAFFRQIVCDLSRALHAHGAFTSQLLPNRRARMLAFWVGGRYEACLEYSLEGTPCDFVYKGEITAYARNVGDVFPVDRAWFEELGGIQSYLGIPVKDETGAVCGHLAVMDICERDWADADVDALRLFSLRSAAELERTRHQRELEEANSALRQANERLSKEIQSRIAAESQLAASKALAESANRAKSLFISQMSHELRTPLNGILGFAQLLKREGDWSPQKLQEGLAVIERSGEHLLRLVNDLLDLAKIEAGKLELSLQRVDLREVLEDVASFARVRAADAGLMFNVDANVDTLSPVVTDERVIRQILLNLLGNAVKFTEAGGRVTLRAEGSERAPHQQWLKFVVEDTGIGIAEPELERIFEPFHRINTQSRMVEGTGLGLTITQRLVAALEGRLSVSSQRGVGSTFTVECEFPVAREPAVAAFEAVNVVGYEGETRHILVADDDEANRILVTRLLEGIGFSVQTAANGREALERTGSIAPDLVLTDLFMPEVDGMELARRLRADPALASIPLIAMSASASERTRDEAIRAGCSDFVRKPLNLASFLEAIGAQLQLQWRRAPTQEPAPGHTEQVAEPYRLAPDLIEELQDLAMQGDVIALTRRIEATLARDSSAVALCEEMRELVAHYDMRGIRKILAANRGA